MSTSKWFFLLYALVSAGVHAADVDVLVSATGLSVMAPPGTHVVVRIGTPADELHEISSATGALFWMLPAGSPDGEYRYDVYTESAQGSAIDHGMFKVEQGVMRPGPLLDTGKDRVSSLLSPVYTALNWMLNLVVPVADAADLVASSGIPSVFFDDTDNNPAAWGNNDWSWFVGFADVDTAGTIVLLNRRLLRTNISIDDQAPLFTLAAGASTVTIANGDLAVDHVNNRVGINTTAPQAPLHIASGSASATELFRFTNSGGSFITWEKTSTNANWFMTHENAARGALIIDHQLNGGLDGPEFTLDQNGQLTISSTLVQNSNVHDKTDIKAVDAASVLTRLEQLPISQWRYKWDKQATHAGPMAQDFHQAFGYGEDETKIAPADMAGVALAGIKALKAQHEEAMAEKDVEIAALKSTSAHQQAQINALQIELRQTVDPMKVRLESLERQSPLVRALVN